MPETQAEVPTEYKTMYVVNCNESISLRTAPSTAASTIRQIPLGEAVSYISNSSDGFCKISYLGNTGYALASYLSEYKPAYTEPIQRNPELAYFTCYVINCNESITLRTAPTTGATEICQIPLGSAVTYVEQAQNGFDKIIYNGHTGYALDAYIGF